MARIQKNLPPVDENVQLPSAIRKAAERANQIHKEAYEAAPPSNEPVKLAEPEAKPPSTVTIEDFKPVDLTKLAPAPTPEATPAPQPTNENRFSLPGDTVPAPAPAPTPAPTPAPQPAPTPTASEETVPKRDLSSALGRLKQATAHIEAQAARIQNLEAMVIQLTQPVTAPEMRAESLITEDERNTYGEDFLTVVGKKVREELGKEVAQLGAEVQNLKGGFSQVSQSQAMAQADRFEAFMDRSMPNWRAQNEDLNFIAWLGLPDPASGVIRSQLLSNAHQKGDFNRVAWFFKGYNAETAPPSPASVPTPTAPAGKVPLETLAAPGRAKSAAAPSTADEYITRSDMNRFYRLSNSGYYNDNPKEKDRLEKLIFKAIAEGKVIDG